MKQEISLTTYITEYQNDFYRLAYYHVRNKDKALEIVRMTIVTALAHEKELGSTIEAYDRWFQGNIIYNSNNSNNLKKALAK